jgi:putative dimethyl sulfoxide reductase chaperone
MMDDKIAFTSQELNRLARFRSQIYAWLSAATAQPPGDAFVGALLGPGTATLLDALATEPELPAEVSAGLAEIHAFLAAARTQDPPEMQARLAAEYEHLFGAASPTPAHEAYFRDGRSPGPSTAEVEAAYAAAEYHGVAGESRAADQLGAELAFLRYLAAQEGRAWERGGAEDAVGRLQEQRRFLAEHLLVWVGAFCGHSLVEARQGLYCGLCRLLPALLARDAEQVELLADLVTLGLIQGLEVRPADGQ